MWCVYIYTILEDTDITYTIKSRAESTVLYITLG